MRAVEVAEPVFVRGEVSWDPVQDHADAVLVEYVDQVHEVLRGAVAAGRSEEAGDLIAPGAKERVLHHRHEFNMGEAHFLHVSRQLRCQLTVRQRPMSFFRHAHPRTGMDFVNGQRRRQAVGVTA